MHDGDRSYTYRELCSHATAVALRLRKAGVTRESQVALVAPRSAWFLVMAVGVLFAGGVYVPLDPTMPAERRDPLLRGARVVVAEDGVEVPPETEATRLSPEELRAEAESAAGAYGPEAVRDLLGPRQRPPTSPTSSSPPARRARPRAPVWNTTRSSTCSRPGCRTTACAPGWRSRRPRR
ncbi:AMP-binding protein [Streptomyces stramineus]